MSKKVPRFFSAWFGESDLAGPLRSDLTQLSSVEEIVVADFEPVEIAPGLLWDAKVALFETRFADAEELLREKVQTSVWAMSVFVEVSGLSSVRVGADTRCQRASSSSTCWRSAPRIWR